MPVNSYDLVDPELRPALGPFRGWRARKLSIGPRSAWLIRRLTRVLGPKPLASPAWEERRLPGAAGAPPVPVHVINRRPGAAPRPAILHMHGGGYVIGNARIGVAALQPLAQELDCLIVTVDYRLAPETRFPGALEDNYCALRWLAQNAQELGADPERIVVMGESAGGGHAAMLAIAARDRGEVPLAGQVLIYPMLDDRTGTATPPPGGHFVWNAASNRYGWSALLGMPAGSAEVPAGAVPARVGDLRGLPPAFIGVGALDLFFEEDLEYARRLQAAGVPVKVEVIEGAYHGFDVFQPQAAASRRLRAAWVAALRRAFSLGSAPEAGSGEVSRSSA
jgi:acetyl esterase/lipase